MVASARADLQPQRPGLREVCAYQDGGRREAGALGVPHGRGAIDVAVTALRRAVQLSAPNHRARRMLATAELAYERGRPDITVTMLREIERLDLEPLDVARVRLISELMDARAMSGVSPARPPTGG